MPQRTFHVNYIVQLLYETSNNFSSISQHVFYNAFSKLLSLYCPVHLLDSCKGNLAILAFSRRYFRIKHAVIFHESSINPYVQLFSFILSFTNYPPSRSLHAAHLFHCLRIPWQTRGPRVLHVLSYETLERNNKRMEERMRGGMNRTTFCAVYRMNRMKLECNVREPCSR